MAPANAKPWFTRRIMNAAELWIADNNLIIDLFQKLTVEVSRIEGLDRNSWYLIFSNHQSWTDIIILQRIFTRRIPLLKFFIKQELIWVPLIGIAWWILDFPIMKRYSREQLKRHPELMGKDLDATRRSCEKFKFTPVSILNFLEGTRFTEAKHDYQQSPFEHLLKPKGGGAAMVLRSMGDQIDKVIDITIIYPEGVPGFFDFLSGRISRVIVEAQQLDVPAQLQAGDYETDREFKTRFQAWITELWKDKDKRLQNHYDGTANGQTIEHQREPSSSL